MGKKLLSFIFASLLAISASVAAEPLHVKEQILVMPKAGLSEQNLNNIVHAQGATGIKKLHKDLDIYVVTLPSGMSEVAIANKLSKNPNLKFAEVDGLVPLSWVPNDPLLPQEWHIPVIQAFPAWSLSNGGGVTIAILDTGVTQHTDLVQSLVPGWNYYDNNSDTTDFQGHGTAVSGTAGANGNNGIGVAGVAYAAKLMPMRISYPDGNGGAWGVWSLMVSALTDAANKGVRVANISYGGLNGSSSIISAGQYFKNKNGLVVVAAENTGTELTYAYSDYLIPVSATGHDNLRTSWSSYGAYVKLAAPGTDIYTTWWGNTKQYAWGAGTSFSSPVTAGVVALMMSVNPLLPSSQIESILLANATDIGTAGWDKYYGWGLVNASAAVAAAKAAIPVADTIAPTISITAPTSGNYVSGIIPVNVTSADNLSVTKVELRVNTAVVTTDTNAPFGFSWDTTTVANGVVNLTATAYDAAGNKTTSTNVAVNVANYSGPDITPPVVKIISPVNGAHVGRNQTISTTASDDRGQVSQTLSIDGVVKATGTTSITYNWFTKNYSVGNHTISVVAKDPTGNTATTSITVNK